MFPTDFSALSRDALPYAVSMARDFGAKLLLVHVEEPIPLLGPTEATYAFIEPDHAALRKQLADFPIGDTSVACERHLLLGGAADMIVGFAAAEQADLIVMATHGRSGLSHLLMGSVAEAVVRRAHCPVLTLKSAAMAHSPAAD
ncbi:MAG TPA: universal stress protein [Pirellulales bacterium]|nr:universal stress protein [Pirellulales bacterium]